MEIVHEFRSDRRRLIFVTAASIGGLWIFLAGFTVCAAIWWPDHAILIYSMGRWIGGAFVLSCPLGAIALFQWLVDRKTVWLVTEEGVTIRRAADVRPLAWSEIHSLHVLPFAAILRVRSKPYVERLNWVARADIPWLRDLAKKHCRRAA